MFIKKSVRVRGLSNEILLAIVVCADIYRGQNNNPLFITSLTDGQHMPGSLHACGDAVDIRLPSETSNTAMVQMIRAALTSDYDVVLEADHIHIEYDPRRILNELPPNKANA
jgi:hypothetical protein